MDIDLDSDNDPDAGAIEGPEESYGKSAHRHKKRKIQLTAEEEEARDNASPGNLHVNDPGNFLKLCLALRLLLAKTITDEDIDKADTYIPQYCQELIVVCKQFCSPLSIIHNRRFSFMVVR